jgi:hypothetical protein
MNEELFGELHEEEQYGLFGREHHEQFIMKEIEVELRSGEKVKQITREWIDVRDKLPELNSDGESNEVLCITRKFGFAQNITETDSFVILWWDGEAWQGGKQDDYENNADYVSVVYWMPIPKLYVGK